MAKQRARNTPWGEDGAWCDWFTVETPDGNAVAGVDGRFDFEDEQDALELLQAVAAEVGKPLTVVRHKRLAVATYQAVMKIEKVEPEEGDSNSK